MAESFALVKGTLDVLVLKALSSGPMHGYEITRWLEQHCNGRLDLKDSALYQAVYRMEARGLVEAEWGVTENNRKAKYYRITRAGCEHLAAESARFLRYADMVAGILALAPGST